MKFRMLTLIAKFNALFSYLPIGTAKIKPFKYCLTKIMKLSTIKVYYFNSSPNFFSESKKLQNVTH